MNFRRFVPLLAALALLGPAPLFAQFDEGEREKKKDVSSDANREATAWAAFLKKLGPGPVYRVEVLARDGSGFFLHQALLSPSVPLAHTMFGLGLDDKGKPIPPPDPGYARTQESMREVSKGGKELFPLAWRTHYFRASLEGRDVPVGRMEIVHSDLATSVQLPDAAGGVTRMFFGALWRIERLTPEQMKKLVPLRQDAKAFRDRVAAIRGELKSAKVLGIERDRDKKEFSRYLPQAP